MVSFQLRSEFYSHVFKLEKSYDGWSHFCGASIVSTRHAVTAAHCLSDYEVRIQDFSILAGTHQLSCNGTRYYVKNILIHDKFNSKKNDIALIKTNKTIVYVANKVCN